jgi:hypothetical protein
MPIELTVQLAGHQPRRGRRTIRQGHGIEDGGQHIDVLGERIDDLARG